MIGRNVLRAALGGMVLLGFAAVHSLAAEVPADELAEVLGRLRMILHAGRPTDTAAQNSRHVLPNYPSPAVGPACRAAILLKRLPAAERYRVLHDWTFSHRGFEAFNCFAPEEFPPEIFFVASARRADAAGGDRLGPFGDRVVSFSEMLVAAAAETGRLKELREAVEKAVRENGDFADTTLVLVALASQDPELETGMGSTIARLTQGPVASKRVAWPTYLIARGALRSTRFVQHGERLADLLIGLARLNGQYAFHVHLLHDRYASRAARAGDPTAAGADPGLSLWSPAGTNGGLTAQVGFPPSWWAMRQGHVAHLGGQEIDWLFFNYPLSGTFEFAVDGYMAGWQEAAIAYGGLIFEPIWNGQDATLRTPDHHDAFSRPIRPGIYDAMNRLAVQVSPERVRYVCNGRLIYEDKTSGPTSPWLALIGRDARRTVWSGARISGQPVIPRSVPLVQGDHMDGWIARSMGSESLPARFAPEPLALGTLIRARDWTVEDGVLRASAGTTNALALARSERGVVYHRPLRSGERVEYEFLHQPGKKMVHPAVGRIAVRLEPEGVRLRWLADDGNWPRAVVAGLGRGFRSEVKWEEGESAKRPPLKIGWNAVSVQLDGDTVAVRLNGEEVCRLPLEPWADRRFGLNHSSEFAVEVRKVTLTGNWPEKLAAEQWADLTSPAADRRGPAAAAAAARVQAVLVGEEWFGMDVEGVLAAARAMPPERRLAYLRQWVLPEDVAVIRLFGSYAPSDPAPPVQQAERGGTIRSPALELIRVARELGKLDELAGAVKSRPATDEYAARAKAALLVAIHAAREQDEVASQSLGELKALVKAEPLDTPLVRRWPEAVAGAAAVQRPPLLPDAAELFTTIVERQIRPMASKGVRLDGFGPWEIRMRHAAAYARLGQSLVEPTDFGADPGLEFWTPVVHATAQTRGQGMPMPHWMPVAGELRHYPGHGWDYLYFAVPLQGDGTIDARLSWYSWREAYLGYGARIVRLRTNRNQYTVDRFDREGRPISLAPPMEQMSDWNACRIEVQGGRMRFLLNGRQLHEEQLPEPRDPWLMLVASGWLTAGTKNVKLGGEWTVPESLDLSADSSLSGWRANYYDVPQSEDSPVWTASGGVIVGRFPSAESGVSGAGGESVLFYHRPLVEDAQVDYEFYYQPDKAVVHPALDRCVFLMEPGGMKIHWLTDGKYDRTGLAADNVTVEPANRRGELSLKPRQWNQVRLVVKGNMAGLQVNGTSVYERALEPGNRRFFGLFHVADQMARVRNVTYRGAWPRAVPPAESLFRKTPP